MNDKKSFYRLIFLFSVGVALFTFLNVNQAPALTISDASLSFKGIGTLKEQPSSQKKQIIPTEAQPVMASFHQTGKDVKIRPTGLDQEGRMDTVDNPKELSWYNTKGHPVQNVLLSSHRDWGGELGVLYGLENWKNDQLLTLTLQNNQQLRYQLRAVNVYHKSKVPKEVMELQKGDPRVTVITCTGDFIEEEGGYTKRVIATFEPVD